MPNLMGEKFAKTKTINTFALGCNIFQWRGIFGRVFYSVLPACLV